MSFGQFLSKNIKPMDRNYERWARALFREKMERDYVMEIAAVDKQGYERGKREAHQEKLEIAHRMKQEGIAAEQIQTITGSGR